MERTIKVIQKGISKIPSKKRVVAYARVSNGKDAMLHSLSAQVSYYSNLIQNNNEWSYVGVYADEAVTGTKDNREEFNKLLDECRNRKVDMIITKSISRFARNTVKMLETVRELKELNVDVFFEKENIHSMSGDGELMLTILASFSQEESRSVSENCKWRIRKGFEQGELINLRFIYGYRIDKGKIEIYEEEAQIVRMIFQDYLDGYGCTVIAKKLREMKVKKLRGGKWNSERVADIIKNEKYIGNALLQKKYVKDHLTKKLIKNKGTIPQYYAEETHPAIIDIETFKRAQEIMKVNRIKYKCEPGKKNYIFTSKIQCGICGKNYKHKDRNGRSTWVCSNHHKYGDEGCIAKPICEEQLIKLLNVVLQIKEFDEDIFNETIEKIKIEESRTVIVILKNGKVIKKGMV
ncbi:recombinase family protein [Clostridium celatum]|uniref:recombinase family protein n=1 Tax=Clostridium celatum TaxID=36834 RepID=UPI001F28C97E|nr:recombinase family protein [Clostridium celatum]MCE9654176.1 recombinase family protein [Clostridium celatum]